MGQIVRAEQVWDRFNTQLSVYKALALGILSEDKVNDESHNAPEQDVSKEKPPPEHTTPQSGAVGSADETIPSDENNEQPIENSTPSPETEALPNSPETDEITPVPDESSNDKSTDENTENYNPMSFFKPNEDSQTSEES